MTIPTIRRLLIAVFVLLVGSVAVLGLAGRLAPAAGYHLFSVRSGSMAPAIPVGALVVAHQPTPARVGDVISLRLPNQVVVTHRVTEVVDSSDGDRLFATKGDANAAADPALVPQEWAIGTVVLSIPVLGYLLAMLALPTGIAALLSTFGALLTAIWVLEEFEDEPGPAGDGAANPVRA